MSNRENFQSRIIEESRGKREKRIRDALSSYCRSQKDQLFESKIPLFREIPEEEWNETLEIMQNQIKKKSFNTKNAIYCLKLIGGGWLLVIILFILSKLF